MTTPPTESETLREKIARVIDPWVFMEDTTRHEREAIFAKADAILALLPTGGVGASRSQPCGDADSGAAANPLPSEKGR